jgi:DDE superfamily endonuclease
VGTDLFSAVSAAGGAAASPPPWNTYIIRGALTRRGKVYFLDAAHLLHAAIPSQGSLKRGKTMQLKTNSGRNRLNILGAYSPDERDLISLEGRESCDSERVAQLLQKIRAANPGKRLLIVLDNTPYNHADPVSEAAKRLRIELLYLPTYSPNLNLIEERPTDYTWRPRQPQQLHPNLPPVPSFGGSDRRSGSALSTKGRSNLLGHLPA